jgi:Mg2+/citrate symporter
VQSGDTLANIATALAVQISGASSSGAVITLPASAAFEIRIGSEDVVGRILRRQEKDFQVTVWAGSPAVRAATALAVDNGLSALTSLNMPDGSPTFSGISAQCQVIRLSRTSFTVTT